jgi:hypothetical protein
MAEYEALLCGLRVAIETGIKCLDVRGDSQLVIDQVMKNVSCHNEKMEAYCNVLTVKFRQPSHEFCILSIGTNPRGITSSLVHVGFGVKCLRRVLTLKANFRDKFIKHLMTRP